VEIVNRPGGGSILGANWFAANAKPNGEMILFTTSSSANPYVLEQPSVKYDLSEMKVAYSFPFGAVAYVAPSTGITKPEDLKSPKTPLIYGGISATASDLPGLLSFEVLGLDVKSVLGFTGRGPVRLAFERGETNFDYQFTPVYLTQVAPQVESGGAVPLMTGGAVGKDGRVTERDPVFPNLPSVYEVYKTLNDGKEPSGEAWDAYQSIAALTYTYGLTGYLPPETPQEIIDIFNKAVAAINADPEFKKASEKIAGGYSLIPPSEAEKPLKAALKPTPQVKAYLKDLLSTKYGVKF
jgi:tripartite-type tricarboxylate transporter receptor subunit TctC